nr:DUF1349 domain-containing protein [Micromonospora noduli]
MEPPVVHSLWIEHVYDGMSARRCLARYRGLAPRAGHRRAGATVWLRVSRIDGVYAYHASVDGETWQLIRVFLLDPDTSRDRIGLAGQSPTGEGCGVTFDEITFRAERLADLRDGS